MAENAAMKANKMDDNQPTPDNGQSAILALNAGSADRGYRHERTEIVDDVGRLEKALADLWRDKNQPRHWMNFGNGILQDLFVKGNSPWNYARVHDVTDSERMVAATAIQWLGTNCGRAFLHEAAQKAGWTLSLTPNDAYEPRS